MSFNAGYAMPPTTAYKGTFTNIPDRVGSAPAVDFSVVILLILKS